MLISVKDRSFWINIKVIGSPVNDHMGCYCLEKNSFTNTYFAQEMIKRDGDETDEEFNKLCEQLRNEISNYVSKDEYIDSEAENYSPAPIVNCDEVIGENILSSLYQ